MYLKQKIMDTQTSESKYLDPDNVKEIRAELRLCPNMGEVMKLINRVFPDWVVAFFNGFCAGYPHLTNNWHILCSRIGVKPAQVLIVRELNFDDNHTLLKEFCECLTQAGFAVKQMVDYLPCSKCENIAVPTPPIHETMKEKGIKVPDINIRTCMACQSS